MLKILHYYWCWIAIFHCWASRVSYVQFSVVDGVTWIFPPTPRFLQFFEEKVSCNGLSACVWFLHANFSCKIRCPCKTMVLTYSSMYKSGGDLIDWGINILIAVIGRKSRGRPLVGYAHARSGHVPSNHESCNVIGLGSDQSTWHRPESAVADARVLHPFVRFQS